MVKQRISIGKFWIKIGMVEEVMCPCCDKLAEETFYHLFITCPATNLLGTVFARGARIKGPFIYLKETIYKWWHKQCSSKLRPIFNVVPCFILWMIWKKKINLNIVITLVHKEW